MQRGLRSEWDGDPLAALASDGQMRCRPRSARLDVSAGGLGHSQLVQGQQRDEGVLTRRAEAGGDEEGARPRCGPAGGVGLVVQAVSADVDGRGVVQWLLLDGVLVAPCDGAQPADDGYPRPRGGFEVAPEPLDVGAAHLEQAQLVAVPIRQDLQPDQPDLHATARQRLRRAGIQIEPSMITVAVLLGYGS